MRTRRPVLRVALLALTAALLGLTVVAAGYGWRVHRYVSACERATVVVAGTVVQDRIGDLDDIRVRWTDHTGREHVQRFGVYDTDRYAKGREFRVAYDPSRPAQGFPADPEETSARDDLVAPIVIAAFAAALLALAWAVRGLLFRRAAARPGRPMVASVLAGDRSDGPPVSLGSSTWIALTDDRRRAAERWQRVMWHPVLNAVTGAVAVTVHGDVTGTGRVVVEMPGQVRLVPCGRLRHRPPRRVTLTGRADTDVADDDLVILPAGVKPPRTRPWWARAVTFALVGATLGGLCAVAFAGGPAVLPAAAGGAALLVNLWALAGAAP
ncbi:DUF3592 domain-containing protein [Micromonospora sp. NBS 11-29]|uniref:DUF3592 domain-containing protein n=1 Tax=Micromonospora sp. NBS 11-29 TaxID=1960879 RepID=UPI001592EC28|nr:DUF3592 domain-containing protein [Micromonospora sp. NBS 11-29]